MGFGRTIVTRKQIEFHETDQIAHEERTSWLLSMNTARWLNYVNENYSKRFYKKNYFERRKQFEDSRKYFKN